jgi:ribosomal protein S18 acetylase RimI-like enzyme
LRDPHKVLTPQRLPRRPEWATLISMTIDIRVLIAGDEEVLRHVADDVFDNAVDPRLGREFLSDPRHHLVVALDAGVVVGMVSAVDYIHPDKRAQLWINEIGVASSHQRRGVGRDLMAAMLSHGRRLGCTEAWLGTEPDNVAARALYVAAGGSAETMIMYSFDLDEDAQGQ